MFTYTIGLDNKIQHQIFNALTKPIGYLVNQTVQLKQPTKNRAYLQMPKCTQDSLEISVINIEYLKGLN
jgi:hypothetical protein